MFLLQFCKKYPQKGTISTVVNYGWVCGSHRRDYLLECDAVKLGINLLLTLMMDVPLKVSDKLQCLIPDNNIFQTIILGIMVKHNSGGFSPF